jgi:hypothetical protein
MMAMTATGVDDGNWCKGSDARLIKSAAGLSKKRKAEAV